MPRPQSVIAATRPDLARSRSTDVRPVEPQLPAYSTSGQAFASFLSALEADQLGLSGTSATEAGLRGIPAANFARNRIANAVAMMSPLKVYDGTTEILPTPLVAHRPLVTLGIFDYWHQAISHALTSGNFVGVPIDDGRQVLPIPSHLVNCYRDRAGYDVYAISGMAGPPLSSEEVIHVRGPHTIPGDPWALSPVTVFATAIGEAIDLQRYGASAFRDGGVPAAALTLDQPAPLPDGTADAVRANWVSHHAGKKGLAVLPRGLELKVLSWSPHDAEFINAKQMTVAEMALVFDLDPTDLTATVGGQAMTYANIFDRQNDRIVSAYGPWMRRFEEAWTDLLPLAQCAEFEPERTMRMSPKDLAEVQGLRIASGITDVDEERALEGRPPKQGVTQ